MLVIKKFYTLYSTIFSNFYLNLNNSELFSDLEDKYINPSWLLNLQSYSLPYLSDLNSRSSGIRARLATSESCLDSLSLLAGHSSTSALDASESILPRPKQSYPAQDLRLDTLQQAFSGVPLHFEQTPPLSLVSHRNSIRIVQPPSLSLRVLPQKSSSLSPKEKPHVLIPAARVAQLYRQAVPSLRNRPLPRVKAISRRSREFYEQLRAANRRGALPGFSLSPNAATSQAKPSVVPPQLPVPQQQNSARRTYKEPQSRSCSTTPAKNIERVTPVSPAAIKSKTPLQQQSDSNSNPKALRSETSALSVVSLHLESISGTAVEKQLVTQVAVRNPSDLHNLKEVDQKPDQRLAALLEPESTGTAAVAAAAAPVPASSPTSSPPVRINYSDLVDPSAVLILSASSSTEPTSASSTPPPPALELPHRPHQISPISEEEAAETPEEEYFALAPDTNRRYSAVLVELNRRFSALELRTVEQSVTHPRPRPASAIVCGTVKEALEETLEAFGSPPVECASEITLTASEAAESAVMATRPQSQPPPVQAAMRVAAGGVQSSNGPSDSSSAFANAPDTGATSSATSTLDRDTVLLRNANARPAPPASGSASAPPQPQPRTSVALAARQPVADTPQRASIAASLAATLEAPSAAAPDSAARVLYAWRMQAVEVTVFQERALVHRACSLQLPAGPSEICIKALPHAIDKDSIRCAAPNRVSYRSYNINKNAMHSPSLGLILCYSIYSLL